MDMLFLEHVWFSLLPPLLFVAFAALRLYVLKDRPRRIAGSSFQIIKLIAIATYGVLQFAILVLLCLCSELRSTASIAAAAISFLDTPFIGFLSHQEHAKSLRPSTGLAIYLLVSLLYDTAQARTLWCISYDRSITFLFTAAIGVKAAILLLEAKEKMAWLKAEDTRPSPEETSSIFSRSVFYWVNGLIVKGYRKTLLHEDLYPLGDALSPQVLYKKFWIAWQGRKFQNRKSTILAALFNSLRWSLLLPIAPRLFVIGFTFGQPLFISYILQYLQEPHLTGELEAVVKFTGAYVIINAGLAISSGFYGHSLNRALTKVRSCLVSAIYRKSTEINLAALDKSSAITLMSTDIQRIEDGLMVFHDLWGNTAEVGIATWLLQKQLGAAFIIPITVAVLSAMGSVWLSSKAGILQTAWVEKTQRRVGMIVAMLPSMTGVKMLGLSHRLRDLIQDQRVEEVRAGTRFRFLGLFNSAFAFTPITISPVVTFAAFVYVASRTDEALNTTRIFTSVSLLYILSSPLMMLFQLFPDLMAALACMRRIEIYLEAESRADRRLLHLPTLKDSTVVSGQDGRNGGLEVCRLGYRSCSAQSEATTLSEYPVIRIREGSFGWIKNQDILHDINLSIPRSKLTLVVGPVACGKSTLLQALLGETLGFRGTMDINESSTDIAFCSQTPFLVNASLQRNILGFSEYDSTWYNTVIEAAALRDDISAFPQKDKTVIGTSGTSLSGGQRQRLAIARAVYARKKIAVFDDVLSGQDPITEQHIFDHIFGPQGLLRQQTTTVILATHATKFLSFADNILALGVNGTITEVGSFDELCAAQGYVHSLSIQKSEKVQCTPPHDNGSSEVVSNRNEGTTQDTNGADDGRLTGDSSVYRYYLKVIGSQTALLWVILGILLGFFFTVPTLWLKWWSDANAAHSKQVNGVYLAVYAFLQFMSLSSILIFHGHGTIMAYQAGTKLHWSLLETVMAAPMAYFDKTDIGITINRFSQDMELIDGELPFALNNLGVSIFISVAQIFLITIASPCVVLAFPLLFSLFYLIQAFYLQTSQQLRLMELEAKSPLYSHFLETLSGLATIRSFGWVEANLELNDQLLDFAQQPAYMLATIQRWLNLVLDLLGAGLDMIVVGLAVALRGNPGFTGVALVNLISLNMMLKQIIMKWTTVEISIGAVSRVKSFSEVTGDEDQPSETDTPPSCWPYSGGLEMRNVSASYGSDQGKMALDKVTLSITAGEKIGICGRSGAGKSSLVLALFRMIELREGSIMIDGINIARLPREEIRSRINAIPQDPYFLSGTVRLSLDPYGTATDAAMVRALGRVNLWESIVAQGGLGGEMHSAMLSHGQKQLFCLARALLRPGRIVVLDEATSRLVLDIIFSQTRSESSKHAPLTAAHSVDKKTDDLMQRIIREEFQSRTVIVVAHRLDTIIDFDRIALLHNGKLIEYDKPTILLGRDSAFKRLYEMDAPRSGKNKDSIRAVDFT
ncbi:hypothetical protein MMC13_003827 [Lambiella insularis]|nr:hypothetical protein [Lambiella insularis]